jgi:hypothetical protein
MNSFDKKIEQKKNLRKFQNELKIESSHRNKTQSRHFAQKTNNEVEYYGPQDLEADEEDEQSLSLMQTIINWFSRMFGTNYERIEPSKGKGRHQNSVVHYMSEESNKELIRRLVKSKGIDERDSDLLYTCAHFKYDYQKSRFEKDVIYVTQCRTSSTPDSNQCHEFVYCFEPESDEWLTLIKKIGTPYARGAQIVDFNQNMR